MSDVTRETAEGTASGEEAERSSVAPDRAFEALADSRRRAVLSYLHDHPDETLAVESLVDALVEERPELDPAQRRRVAASLTTTHLPELDDGGLLEYDHECRTVRYTDSPLVDGLLERVNECDAR